MKLIDALKDAILLISLFARILPKRCGRPWIRLFNIQWSWPIHDEKLVRDEIEMAVQINGR